MKAIVVGTRASRLAIIQAEMVCNALSNKFPGCRTELKKIKTTGDKISEIPLEKINDKGFFTKELENALIDGEIDLAVHSMKDMSTELPEGLHIGAIMAREQPWDVLIVQGGKSLTLKDLSEGAKIGSSSLRRQAQLSRAFPWLIIEPIRGNLDTRLAKLAQGKYDAIVLAYAGVFRMGWADRISSIIPPEICLPAVGQGAIGIELKKDNTDLNKMIAQLGCRQTEAAVAAERSFLCHLQGGCQVPIGALAEIVEGQLSLKGVVTSLDGRIVFSGEKKGDPARASELGIALADSLLMRGCGTILEQIRRECNYE